MNDEKGGGEERGGLSCSAIGERIRVLRRIRHITQAELARRIGIRTGPMNALENGRHVPSGRVLYKLAEELEASVDFILGLSGQAQSAPVYLAESVEANGARVAPAWPVAALAALSGEPPLGKECQALVDAVIQSFLALEDLCCAQKRAHIPLYVPFARAQSGVEMWTQQVRQVLGIGQAVIFDYLELFENAGLRVAFCPLPDRVESVSFYDARNANAFLIVRQGMNVERQLFELVKRLAAIYLYTRRVYGQLPANEAGALDDLHVARQFAAYFLMPASAVRASVQQLGITPKGWSYELLLRLKHRFGVSAQSFLMRLGELQLIEKGLAAELQADIEAHYRKTHYGEPDASRRILSPNGRLGDLLLNARRRPEAAEEAEVIARKLQKLKLVGMPAAVPPAI